MYLCISPCETGASMVSRRHFIWQWKWHIRPIVDGSGLSLRVDSNASSSLSSLSRVRYLGIFICRGQLFTQRAVKSEWQIPGSHFFSIIWWSYSSRKYLKVVKTGFGAVCPSPQRAVLLITCPSFTSVSRSSDVALPSVTLFRIWSVCASPSRQGVH